MLMKPADVAGNRAKAQTKRSYIMTTFTVTLPYMFTVHSRGVDYTFATDQLPAAMVAMGAIHGFTQKLADSLADKAKVEGREAEVVGAVWDAIVAGEWTRRRTAGPGMSELDTEIFRIARGKVVAAYMAKLGVKKVKELTDMQNEEIDGLATKAAEKHRDTFAPIAQAAIDARRAAKAIDIDL